MTKLTRRAWMAGGGALAGAATIGLGAWSQDRTSGDYPFQLGVACGEPEPDGAVIWTRLSRRPQELGGGLHGAAVPVRWEVAEDPSFQHIVQTDTAIARPERGHALHVEVEGLKPHREYWYRFITSGHASAVGRMVTAPAKDTLAPRLLAGFASCQKFESGYYAAHRHLAEARPDVIFFLGDYIYEKAVSWGGVRHHPLLPANDLETYRLRYAWYRSDPDLQAAHAAAPWMVIWDDHEVANDYSGDSSRGDHDVAQFRRRRAAAYQAYFENMPLRPSRAPRGPNMRMYRTLDWGRLAQFQLLDTRQYRPRPACEREADRRDVSTDCRERLAPGRSLLGARQEAWLGEALRETPAAWNVLTQPYLMNPLEATDGVVSNDGWDGYAATRSRVLSAWQTFKTPNPLSLGGDIHSFVAADLALQPGGPAIGSEFVGGSVSSIARSDALTATAFQKNPNLRFGEMRRRGFGLLELRPDAAEVKFVAVRDALRQGSQADVLARFAVEQGVAGLHAV